MNEDAEKLKGFLFRIIDEHKAACRKHPKFCDEMKNENCDYRFYESLYKERNSKGPYYALDLLQEEIFEAMVAHQYNEKEHCLEELAQCGAVILRMMEVVDAEG